MHVVTLGTIQKGGIDSVIQGYIDNGLFENKKHTRIGTHLGENKLFDMYLFFKASIYLIYLGIKEKKILIHCHMSYKGSFVRKLIFVFIAKILNQKCIVHLHGSEFKDYYSSRSCNVKKLILWLIKNVDEFVVLSDSWKDYIYSISNRKVTVINNYVDIEKMQVERLPGHVLFLGAYIKRKGIYDLINAFKKLNDYHLHICGAGENESVQSLIDKLDLTNSITNHGWVTLETKRKLLSECSVFILPSFNEGLPMVIIEAMACEIPIISTPVGGIPEVIIDNVTGYLVEPGALDGIVKKIDNALRSDNSRIVSNAKEKYLATFSSKTVLPKWETLYATILKSS